MTVEGKVVRGMSLATLAYNLPTANIEPDHAVRLEPGVYAARCWVDGRMFNAVTYAGPFAQAKIEVHIFDFQGDLYDKRLCVEILDQVSAHVPWEGDEQMKKKILNDVRLAREYFATRSSDVLSAAWQTSSKLL